MTNKITPNKLLTLKALEVCTAPWNAKGKSNQLLLAGLGRMGLAVRRSGSTAGWEITEAGRALLREEE